MVRFILGLIVGFLIGLVVMVYNPEFAERAQDLVTDATDAVLRGTEQAADAVGDAARRADPDAERSPADPEQTTQ